PGTRGAWPSLPDNRSGPRPPRARCLRRARSTAHRPRSLARTGRASWKRRRSWYTRRRGGPPMTLKNAALTAAIAEGANLAMVLMQATTQLVRFQHEPIIMATWATSIAAHLALTGFLLTVFLKIGEKSGDTA